LKYKGLAKQIDAGAGYIDWYFKNADGPEVRRKPGEPIIVSSTKVTPANLATAALYTYTPHLHGNRLLWSIMNRWFGDGSGGLRFPDGTLVRNERNGAIALIQGGKFRAILNRSVLASRFNETQVVDLNEFEFAGLQESIAGRPVRFPDLSLVRTEDGTIYLLIGSGRRRIDSGEVFTKIGFNPEEVEDVSSDDIADYADSDPITLDSSFPLGELLQDTRTGGVYYAESGVKHPLWDKALLSSNFAGRSIARAAPSALQKLTTGDPVRFNDGVLVKVPGDASVYVISGGKKRLIPTEEVFLTFGYRWSNVLTTSSKMLSLHETGEPLALEGLPASATSEPSP
jgi:hypothetical protein